MQFEGWARLSAGRETLGSRFSTTTGVCAARLAGRAAYVISLIADLRGRCHRTAPHSSPEGSGCNADAPRRRIADGGTVETSRLMGISDIATSKLRSSDGISAHS